MYRRIGIPVDLEHTETLEKTIETAAALARTFGAALDLVAVTSPSPSAVARDPHAFAEKLAAYAEDCSARHGVAFTAHARVCDDPSVELDRTLSDAFPRAGGGPPGGRLARARSARVRVCLQWRLAGEPH